MNNEKWKRVREKGKKHYVWLHGALVFGVSQALIWSILMHFLSPAESYWGRLIVALILFPIAGLAYGHVMWNKSEKMYAQNNKLVADEA